MTPALPDKRYSVILADPAWEYRAWTKQKSRTADSHYVTMRLVDIMALDVHSIAAPDCALFLWVTVPCLPNAFAVINAWRFRYKTGAFAWVKLTKDGHPKMGLGHYTRGNVELCLLALRGRPRRLAKDVRQVIQSVPREHSRKPDEQYERIERLFAGPYIELFARHQRPGWDAWGLEVAQ